jgi:putative transcriptional regulator
MSLTEKELIERDAKRNIGEELLAAIIDVKAGHHGEVHTVAATEAAEAGARLVYHKRLRSCWVSLCGH